MRLKHSRGTQGFTLGEALVATSIAMLLLGAIFSATVALNRSYAAADDYFSTHMQQIRIMDYLARDVKRSFSVTTSSDLKTVTCIIPNYTVKTGDPEAVADSTTIGIRRTPVVVGTINKAVIDYGNIGARTLTNGRVVAGALSTLISDSGPFLTTDVGKPIKVGTTNYTIASRSSATTVTLSAPITAGTGKTFVIYGTGNRTVTDAATTAGSKTLISATAYFLAGDIGKPVVGSSIDAGTT
ncbi:MAG TPA: hypothetical protein VK474_07010, partial [Chthoniobacterales bacterium]|nr:hypothetical protein [Chthoniobacterales bacterium]